MLLHIERAAFDIAAHDRHHAVCRLLMLLTEGPHEWRPDIPTAVAAERFRGTVIPALQAVREWIDKCVEEAANPAPAMPTARVTADHVADAVADLSRPAVLVVEDSINERTFILALASAFGHERVVQAIEREWLRLAHAGGAGRIGRFTAEERQRFQEIVRVAALLDSDSQRPGEPKRANAKQYNVIRAIDGVSVHMWQWREVENYLPRRVWAHYFPEKRDAIEHLAAMPAEQRGFVDTGQILGKPKQLVPDGLRLTDGDFAELGSAAVAELRAVLAMISGVL